MFRTVALAGLFLFAVQPHSAIAAPKSPHFKECDGFKRPTKKGDGMNSGSFLFGLAKRSEDITRAKATDDAAKGIEACQKALADPLLKPEFKERRASLMQALAYHQMARFGFEDAMDTLDAIDAIETGADPVLYARGIGLGNRMLRAYNLIQAERHEEAVAMLDEIDQLRPYAISIRRATHKLRMMTDDGLDYQIELLKARAPLDPLANLEGFRLALEFSRFDDAVRFGSGMQFELPRPRGGGRILGETLRKYRLIPARAVFGGGLAYAHAAQGDDAAATAVLLAARRELEDVMAPPPPRKNGKPPKKKDVREWETRKVFGGQGVRLLDMWAELIALRKEAPELDLEALMQRMEEIEGGAGPIVIDLVSLAGGTDIGKRADMVSKLLDIAQERRTKNLDVSVFELLEMLPHPESNDNQLRFSTSVSLWDSEGATKKQMDSEDDWTIRYSNQTATGATLEEFNLMAAAAEAQKRGYDHILIQTSRTVQRTLSSYGGYNVSNMGREAQMRVRFVRLDALPAELEGSQWRLLNVAQVLDGLDDLPQKRRKGRK
jgi:hypothetical protein